jgi:pyruvate/2-oxoglutarate dehydrogenase complex dihydrolipoamide acyltransferase (E2) component
MAKLVGTGTDPLGQYGAGVVFDVPRASPQFAELVAKGYANEVAPEDHPGRDDTQIAAAMLRGDALLDPAERAAAERIGDRAIDIVHTADPAADAGDGSPDPEQVRSHADNLGRAGNPDEYGETPEAAEYLSKASGVTVTEGDLATHGDGAHGTGARGGEHTPDASTEHDGRTAEEGTATTDDGIDATDGARELAAKESVDLKEVTGTGENGRIQKPDVEKHIADKAAASA